MIVNKEVTFEYFRDNELWYTTECGFKFPVPINDTGTGIFKNKDKAIFFMRWMNKHLARVNDARAEQANSV